MGHSLTWAGEDRMLTIDEAPGITGFRSLGEGERNLRDPGASASTLHAAQVIGGADPAYRLRGYP